MITKSNPLVSVLIPVYNGERYLSETIESILGQNYYNLELLFIDDFSKDHSVQLIESYSDKRIRVIKNKSNLGQASTMNVGISKAGGKVIFRLDQDDISTPDRIEVQLDKMNDKNDLIIGTWAQIIDENSKIIGYVQHPIDNESIIDSLSINSPLTHSSICISKSNLLRLGGYSEKYNMAMDWDLWIRAARNQIKFFNIPDYLVKVRAHPNQASEVNHTQLNLEKLIVMKKTKNLALSIQNQKAHPVWEFYLEILKRPKRTDILPYIYKILSKLVNYKFMKSLFVLIYYHRVIGKPDRYYHTPIVYKKINEFMKR